MESIKARAKRLAYYNLSIDQWEALNRAQNGLCFICGKPNKKQQRLATDHRHADGLIRGLLCSGCNRLLGKIEDPRWGWGPEHLRRAAEYLFSPPAVKILGQIFGYPGRIGTKKHRAFLRREKRKKSMTQPKPFSGEQN